MPDSAAAASSLRPRGFAAVLVVLVFACGQRIGGPDRLLEGAELRGVALADGLVEAPPGEMPVAAGWARAVAMVGGERTWALRLPGALAGALACVLAALLARRMAGDGAGLLALILSALHGPAIAVSRQATEAALVPALGAALFLSIDVLAKAGPHRRLAAAVFLGSLGLGLSLSWTFLPVAAGVLIDLWHRGTGRAWGQRALLRRGLAVVIVIAAAAPYAVAAWPHLLRPSGPSPLRWFALSFALETLPNHDLLAPARSLLLVVGLGAALATTARLSRDSAQAAPSDVSEPPRPLVLGLAIGATLLALFIAASMSADEPDRRWAYWSSVAAPFCVFAVAEFERRGAASRRLWLRRLPGFLRGDGSAVVRSGILAFVAAAATRYLIAGRTFELFAPLSMVGIAWLAAAPAAVGEQIKDGLGRAMSVSLVTILLAAAALSFVSRDAVVPDAIERQALAERLAESARPGDLVVSRRDLTTAPVLHHVGRQGLVFALRDHASALADLEPGAVVFILDSAAAPTTREVEGRLSDFDIDFDQSGGGLRLRRARLRR